MSDSLDQLLDLLDLEQIEVNIFRGRSPDETVQRVFGGQVAGQALVAAGRTVPPDRPVHSLHAYFIRPGDPSVPLVYTVDRVRDGRSFTTRRVTAIQHGKAIFTLSASFHRPEQGLEHALPMPAVPPPEQLRPNAERLAEALGDPLPAHVRESPIDARSVGPMSVEVAVDPSLRPSAANLVWVRVNGELPDDPLLHVCLMTYVSDLTLLDTVLLEHGVSWHDGSASGRAWTTRCGSTARSAPTSGCSTRRRPRPPPAPAAWPAARCSPRRASWWSRSSRRASSAPRHAARLTSRGLACTGESKFVREEIAGQKCVALP